MNVVFVTGNANKAKYFSELIGTSIEHISADTNEIQAVDLQKITEHKARAAYEQIKRPVIVEDVSLQIHCLGKLPGPFIKWFIDEMGLEKVCRLADFDPARRSTAHCGHAYFDGEQMKYFKGSLGGSIAEHPRGDAGFGWNPIFIPEGTNQTLAEMDDETFKKYYLRIKPINELKKFLADIDKAKA